MIRKRDKAIPKQPSLPFGMPEIMPVWRPIHYLGSKLRLTEAIRERLNELSPGGGRVCDLFAGSGTVAFALAPEREVIAADIQEYSRVLCSAILNPPGINSSCLRKFHASVEQDRATREDQFAPLIAMEELALDHADTDPTLLCDIVEEGSLLTGKPKCRELLAAASEVKRRIPIDDNQRLVASRYFGGVYFSYKQTAFLDAVLNSIRSVEAVYADMLLAAVLSTASDMVNSIGKQFAQPMRPRRADGSIKRHLIRQMRRDRSMDASGLYASWLERYCAISPTGSHCVIRGDYREVLASLQDVALVYADPPYTRDHYSRFYHVLETLCLRDSPEVSTTSLDGIGEQSRGLYRRDRHQSPFCIKSQAPLAFQQLFREARKLNVPLLVSYSPFVKNGHPRLMTVDSVSRLAADYYSDVKVVSVKDVIHSKLTRSELHLETASAAEVFIACRC